MNASPRAPHLDRVATLPHALCCLTLLAAVLSALPAQAESLRVRGPYAEALARALAARLPTVTLAAQGDDSPGPGDLYVDLSQTDGRPWRLLVTDPHQRPLLERALPAEATPDTALLETCALVVDRFLLQIDWKGRPATLAPAEVAAPLDEITLPALSWWTVGIGGLAHAGAVPEEVRAGPLLSLGYRRDAWLVGLRLHLIAPVGHAVVASQRPREVGMLRDLSVTAVAQGGYCLGEGTYACAGVLLGARGTWAWADGQDLYSKQTAAVAAFSGGAFVSGATRLPWQLEVGATLSAAGFLGSTGFRVEGVTDPVYQPPAFEVALAVQLARRFP